VAAAQSLRDGETAEAGSVVYLKALEAQDGIIRSMRFLRVVLALAFGSDPWLGRTRGVAVIIMI